MNNTTSLAEKLAAEVEQRNMEKLAQLRQYGATLTEMTNAVLDEAYASHYLDNDVRSNRCGHLVRKGQENEECGACLDRIFG